MDSQYTESNPLFTCTMYVYVLCVSIFRKKNCDGFISNCNSVYFCPCLKYHWREYVYIRKRVKPLTIQHHCWKFSMENVCVFFFSVWLLQINTICSMHAYIVWQNTQIQKWNNKLNDILVNLRHASAHTHALTHFIINAKVNVNSNGRVHGFLLLILSAQGAQPWVNIGWMIHCLGVFSSLVSRIW